MEEIIVEKNSPTKGRQMKWDKKKSIRQELGGEMQQIQVEMDVRAKIYPNTFF
jgi:hypothetical protein